MSSRIEFSLTPSVTAGVIAGLPWLAVLAFALVAGLVRSPLLLLAALPAAAGAYNQIRTSGLLLGKSSVRALQVENDRLYARFGDGEPVPVNISAESRLTGNLALLKLSRRDTRIRTSLVVLLNVGQLGQNVPAEPFRQLRAWLHLGQPADSTATGSTRHP